MRVSANTICCRCNIVSNLPIIFSEMMRTDVLFIAWWRWGASTSSAAGEGWAKPEPASNPVSTLVAPTEKVCNTSVCMRECVHDLSRDLVRVSVSFSTNLTIAYILIHDQHARALFRMALVLL